LEQTQNIPEGAQWANFLRNHDEIDLGRLTPQQRKKIYDAMGADKSMQLYDRGIRRRLAPMLGNDPQRLAMAYSLLFTLPGTPVIRYGDEIGMGDDLRLKERLSVRTPMQWTSEPHAGFSTNRPFRPVIDVGAYDYRNVNVALQRTDPNSLLTLTTKLIRLRREHPAIGLGTWAIPAHNTPGVLAMRYSDDRESLVTIHNFTAKPVVVELTCPGHFMTDLFSGERVPIQQGKARLSVKGFGYHWFRVE
jgi:maltose alpha-D-glucosyltransferase / alpha-amylase